MKTETSRRIFLGQSGALAAAVLFSACGAQPSDGKSAPARRPSVPGNNVIRNDLMHEGLHLTSWWNNDYLQDSLDTTLDKFQSLGADSISVLSTYYQDTESSTSIYAKSPKTPLDSGIEHALAKIKSRGMRTIFKPHVDPNSGWRGNITFTNEADWQAWFSSYKNFIMNYAQIAEDRGVDLFVIGTELKGTSQRPEWSSIIDNIKSVYGGKITYAANHDEYLSVPFWDKLDCIGVDAYFKLTGKMDPTPDELDAAFQAVAGQLQQFSQQKGKKIMLTEIGYQSHDGTNMTPWEAPASVPDQKEQADCYEAALKAFFNKDFIAGMYFWDTHWNMADLDGFAFIGKQAEAAVKKWYHDADAKQVR